jgi:hypothetical protein
MGGRMMSDAPKYIWLQWIPNDIPNNDEITWCIDPIHEDDTEYVRKDVTEVQNAELLDALKACLPVVQYILSNGWDEAPPIDTTFDEFKANELAVKAIAKAEGKP